MFLYKIGSSAVTSISGN